MEGASTPIGQLHTPAPPPSFVEEDPTVQEVLQELNADLQPEDHQIDEAFGQDTLEVAVPDAAAPAGPPASVWGMLDGFIGDAKLIAIIVLAYIITEVTPISGFITKYLAAVDKIPFSSLIIRAVFTAIIAYSLHKVFSRSPP